MGRGGVPYGEWITIFRVYQNIVAPAIKQLEKEHPELFEGVLGRGNILRLALAKVTYPMLHKWAKTNPGIETEEEIKKAVYSALMSVEPSALAKAIATVAPNLPPRKIEDLVNAYEMLKSRLAIPA